MYIIYVSHGPYCILHDINIISGCMVLRYYISLLLTTSKNISISGLSLNNIY